MNTDKLSIHHDDAKEKGEGISTPRFSVIYFVSIWPPGTHSALAGIIVDYDMLSA